MLVDAVDLASGRLKTVRIEPGYNLRGLRIISIEFQGPHELTAIFTEEGQEWVKTHVLPAFTTKEVLDYFNKGIKP